MIGIVGVCGVLILAVMVVVLGTKGDSSTARNANPQRPVRDLSQESPVLEGDRLVHPSRATGSTGKPKKVEQAVPYEIKGDRLGVLTLGEFKSKYTRPTQSPSKPAPFCSDEVSNRGKDISTVLAEAWHFNRGIVTASTHFPFERRSPLFEGGEPRGEFPTIAGAPADFFIYHFIDRTLYQITITFNQRYYDRVKAAMLAKYGPPDRQQEEILQNRLGATFGSDSNVWNNGVSEMMLQERVGSIDRSSLLLLHTALYQEAKSREPGPRTDDL
jgi:hypothetical protein